MSSFETPLIWTPEIFLNEEVSKFETPLIWTPEMSLDEVELEIDQMVDRAHATYAWLDDWISTSDFLDLLDEQDIDVFNLVDSWENQIILI